MKELPAKIIAVSILICWALLLSMACEVFTGSNPIYELINLIYGRR